MTELTDTKRAIIDRLKRSDGVTPAELAGPLGLTEAAVRQHLAALGEMGFVQSTLGAPVGRGRPATLWRLTDLARELFPDRHADLTVELIGAVRATLGEQALEQIIEHRTIQQLAVYRARIDRGRPLGERVRALASQRSAEGYVAEVLAHGDGAFTLIEHHCPVCAAAQSCQGLCRAELELFRAALGDDCSVERTQHVLSGGSRCAYEVHLLPEPERRPRRRQRAG
jgi:predicted ArsR family transcriptional regulator